MMDPPFTAIANFVADFGEFVALAPAAVAVGVFLALGRRRSFALAWSIGMGFAVLAVALFKAQGLPVSGHAAMAMSFEGGLAVLMWRDGLGLGAGSRVAAIILALLSIMVFASVALLRWHSWQDLAVGSSLGFVTPLGLALVREQTARAWRVRGLGPVAATIVVVLIGAFHGMRLDPHTERRVALDLERALLGISAAAARPIANVSP